MLKRAATKCTANARFPLRRAVCLNYSMKHRLRFKPWILPLALGAAITAFSLLVVTYSQGAGSTLGETPVHGRVLTLHNPRLSVGLGSTGGALCSEGDGITYHGWPVAINGYEDPPGCASYMHIQHLYILGIILDLIIYTLLLRMLFLLSQKIRRS
jgi:hypothetical protein